MTLNDKSGFSLIEVLLALAIFILAAGVLTQAFINTLMGLEGIESDSALQADVKWARSVIIQEPDLDTFEEGGEIMALHSGAIEWEVTVDPLEVVDLFQVDLVMRLEHPDSKKPLELRSELILLRPTWSDPVERSELLGDKTRIIEEERRYRN